MKATPTSIPERRRIRSAAEARAWLEQLAESEGRPSRPLEQLADWLDRYRSRTRGLPFLQLLADDLARELEQGTLEYVGLLFLPTRADIAHGYLIWGTLALLPGARLSLSELALAPLTPNEQGVSAQTLRQLSVSSILARVHGELASRAELAEIAHRFAWPEAPNAQEQADLSELTARAETARPRPGRPALSDAHLARIARAYLAKQAEGYGRGILLAIAAEEKQPRGTIRDWVAKARRRGFLSPGTPGRTGALPGPRLQHFPAPAEEEQNPGKSTRPFF